MTRADDPAELAPLLATVEEAAALTEELRTRYRTHRPVRGVMVTDLLDPRAAYWRSVHPLPSTPEEEARLQAGQELHERLGRFLVPASAREVRVRRRGIVGRIDVLDGRPVELKSTASPPRAEEDLRASRPTYLEQLAMYAALAGHSEGRLIVVSSTAGVTDPVGVWDVGFGRVDRIEDEMARRAQNLRDAKERGDPSGLPRCAWFDRGCSYRSSGVCGCAGTETPIAGTILDEVHPPAPNPAEATRIAEWLSSAPVDPSGVARYRDLAYPRRRFFDERFDAPAERRAPPPTGEADETWSALQGVLEDGPEGEYAWSHAESGEPAEGVACFRGEPCLVKSTRSLRVVPADRVAQDRPHYLLELALRCAGVGVPSGYLFTGLERVPSDGPWIVAQHVRFGSADALRALFERREAALRAARVSGSGVDLPACPRWMADGCAHAAVCGCAADPPPSRS
ncbi:MAG: hypothetical protein L3J77_03495 [Thermoplasmata archaeon]|nr:hypothetical protein [Thermoplasmata archaeon]